MSRRISSILCCLCLLAATAFAGDPPATSPPATSKASNDSSSATRDATSADVRGIPKHRRYLFAVVAGAALGAGVGALLPPGSGKSATKGMLIGGSTASLLYLSSHKNEVTGKWRPFAWVATNAFLAGGIGWAVCNCGGGFPVGALIGGGFTGAVQAFEPRHHQTLSKYTGADPNAPQPATTQPPPAQTNPPQATPPSQPPQESAPPDAQTPPPDTQTPPQTEAANLPDSPQPKAGPDLPPLERM